MVVKKLLGIEDLEMAYWHSQLYSFQQYFESTTLTRNYTFKNLTINSISTFIDHINTMLANSTREYRFIYMNFRLLGC